MPSCWSIERGILRQDRPLQLLEPAAGRDSDFDKLATGLLVALQGVGLAPTAVQREHQLGLQALPKRMLMDERVKLADQSSVLAQRKVRVDPILERSQLGLLEPPNL